MKNLFSKYLKDRSGNRPIRMGNQLEHGGVIAQTDSLPIVDEPIAFTSTVDFTNANVAGLPYFATEIDAIDGGVAFGEKYLNANGVIQTVTKIKQTLNFPAGVQNTFGFLIDLDTLPSKDILDVLPTYLGIVQTIDGGSLKGFDTAQAEVFNTLTAFTNGRGYIVFPTVAFSYDIYGPPISEDYHTNLVTGQNFVVHNSNTTTSANATSWISLTISATITYNDGVLAMNSATWNKGKGYIVVVSGGPQAAIGSPSTPIPVEDSRPYKVYSAKITQSGTDAPTVVVLENTFNAPIEWTRPNEGLYQGVLAGAFPDVNKFAFIFSPKTPSGSTSSIDLLRRTGTDIVEIRTVSDGQLTDDFIEIRVYN